MMGMEAPSMYLGHGVIGWFKNEVAHSHCRLDPKT